ncbi:hypothetical protein pEaSNUABM40_00194 [Erwinia phage pEa_SNUABM_40]|uniref:Tlde1 domain-containing protein n=1 Tax=Erwinia phage pEa_SNUABM_3 TaxID=2869552 RepID=A0AAE7XIX8_9CAUD|nr:hypothetical protein MPK68_gp191 [Erwinia phage pEa_SNUABM_3]QZE56388.1 hypothetical protein pEaSNUABM3_00191 [Erwinia phage pEa_SNUABM_3]QZE58410.1 hypothetical protein pEaSNUABM40_00194 [Erwinia phage pEa_SNUABM_40]
MWKYEQTTGRLYNAAGKVVATGYAGKGQHKNKHESQAVVGMGPLPVGHYTLNAPRTSAKTGPYAMDLTPAADNVMFGRSAFQMHGDSIKAPGTASSGCIIMPRNIREMVWNSGDHQLEVVV